jgi:hypothetical protein
MKTDRVTKVLERVEAWPAHARNGLAAIAQELDAEIQGRIAPYGPSAAPTSTPQIIQPALLPRLVPLGDGFVVAQRLDAIGEKANDVAAEFQHRPHPVEMTELPAPIRRAGS